MKSILEAQGRAWNVEEVQAWLALWVDTTIQRQLLGAVRNTAIFNKITQEMAIKGYQCSAKQYQGKVERADEEVQESSRWPLSQWSWSRLRGRMCRRQSIGHTIHAAGYILNSCRESEEHISASILGTAW